MHILRNPLVSALVVAAVGALTFLAYQHPNAYQVLFPFLSGIVILVFIGVNIWDLAVTKTYYALSDFLEKTQRNAAIAARINLSVLNGYWWTAYLGGMFYLFFLRYLPDLLAAGHPP